MNVHFIQHVAFEPPGYLLTWMRQQQHTISFTRMFEEPELPGLAPLDLVIVMGGPMSVHDIDRYPWLEAEKKFVLQALAAGKKVIGVCLGAQLMAEALGAHVYPNAHTEIGWFPVQKQAGDMPLLADWPDHFESFHWHGETFDLPKDAVHLLSSEACAHQGFLYKDHAIGLQYHMEATPDLVAAMLKHGQDELVTDTWIQDQRRISDETRYYATNHQLLDILLRKFLK